MSSKPRRLLSLVVLAVLFWGGASTSRAGSVCYGVSVDTSQIPGTPGSLDLQFNPSSVFAQAATATISDFATDGVPGSVITETGGASGVLPSTVTIANSSVPSVIVPANELQQAFTFGTSFSFMLMFSGPAVDSPNFGGENSIFALFVLDANNNPLLADPNNGTFGALLTLGLNADGTQTVTTFPQPGGGSTVVTIIEGACVPEPSSLALLAAGLIGVTGAVRLAVARERRTRNGSGTRRFTHA